MVLVNPPKTVILPSTIASKQMAGTDAADVVFSPEAPLKRNHKVVERSTVMLATPKELHEVLRSGTWATIRYVRKIRKPLVIIFPDGSECIEE